MHVAFVLPTVRFVRGTGAAILALLSSEDLTAAAFGLEPGFKSFHEYCVVFVKCNPPLTWPADATPLAGQGCLTKQAPFNRQDVVASHIAARGVPVEDQGLDHIVRHAPVSPRCPWQVQSKS